MDRLSNQASDVQEGAAQDFVVPDQVFDVWAMVPRQKDHCGHPSQSPCPHAANSADCPNLIRLHPRLIPIYKSDYIDQLPREERNMELVKMALTDTNPWVRLLDHNGQVKVFRGKVVSCGWAQTRAHLGCEGCRENPDRWQFDFQFDRRTSPSMQWLQIQFSLIHHDAVQRMIGDEFQLQYLAKHFKWMANDFPNSAKYDKESLEWMVEQWSDFLDRILRPVLASLGGSLPDFAPGDDSSYSRILDKIPGTTVKLLTDFQSSATSALTQRDRTSSPRQV